MMITEPCSFALKLDIVVITALSCFVADNSAALRTISRKMRYCCFVWFAATFAIFNHGESLLWLVQNGGSSKFSDSPTNAGSFFAGGVVCRSSFFDSGTVKLLLLMSSTVLGNLATVLVPIEPSFF